MKIRVNLSVTPGELFGFGHFSGLRPTLVKNDDLDVVIYSFEDEFVVVASHNLHTYGHQLSQGLIIFLLVLTLSEADDALDVLVLLSIVHSRG